MATLYTTKLPTPDALPAGLEVRVTVMPVNAFLTTVRQIWFFADSGG